MATIGPINLLLGVGRRAFKLFMARAQEIAVTHGEEAATGWVQQQIDRKLDFFFEVTLNERPRLTLVAGGKE